MPRVLTTPRVRGLATRCASYDRSVSEGPPSYLVSDIGRFGVPSISRYALHEIKEILKYVHSPTLRFIPDVNPSLQATEGRLVPIVFDATEGPCADTRYAVLNDACNMGYAPAESPLITVLMGPGDVCPRYAWMRDPAKGIMK